MKKVMILFLALGVNTSPLYSQNHKELLTEELQDILDTKLPAYGIEGAGMTIIFADDSVATITSGYANGVNDKVSSSRNWHWASGTKPLTGFVILQMAEEGLLSIDDPIGDYLNTNEIPNVDGTITIKQLLQHTSGLNEVWTKDEPVLWNAVWSDRTKIWDPREVLNYMPTPDLNKGSHNYANTNTYLLSFIIEEITGKSLEDVFEERIFSPLGMESSFLSSGKAFDMSTLNGVWSGNDNRSTVPHTSYLSSRSGNSAHISTSMDAAKFYRTFYKDSLLTRQTMEALKIPANGSEEVIAENVLCFTKITQTYGYETTMFDIVDEQGESWTLLGHGGNGINSSFSFHWVEKNTTIVLAVNDFGNLDVFGALIFEVLCGVNNGLPVSSESEDQDIAEVYMLSQNYPNPFNPSTQISFEVPVASYLQLKVFNMLGQEVATLSDGRVSAGSHTVQFDAGSLPSGVYIYRLQVGNQIMTKKMLLVK